MQKAKEFFNGKKTFIASFVGAAIGIAYIFELISADQFAALMAIAGSFGLVGMRDAMRKFEK